MALIKGIILSFFLLSGIALPASVFASEDEGLLKEFRENLAKNISAEIADQLRSEYTDTGRAPSDVDRIVADLADALEVCMFDSLVKFVRDNDIPLVELIGDGSEGVVSFEGRNLSKASEFQEIFNPCVNAARTEAGARVN